MLRHAARWYSLDRVYLVSQAPWSKLWGAYPRSDSGESEVLVSDLVSVVESPSRLPSSFANELYQAGESGMGYTVFAVVFKTTIPFLDVAKRTQPGTLWILLRILLERDRRMLSRSCPTLGEGQRRLRGKDSQNITGACIRSDGLDCMSKRLAEAT
jgi:hypothetical protein